MAFSTIPDFRLDVRYIQFPLQELQEIYLPSLEAAISSLPDGSGMSDRLAFWLDSNTLDDTTIVYSSGKLGFGATPPTPSAYLHFAPASGNKVQSINTTQPTLAVWNEYYTATSNSGDSQNDHVINRGWNHNGVGAVALSGKGAFFEQFESHYRPGGGGDPREWYEYHLNFIDYAGVTRRPYYVAADKPTGTITQSFIGSDIAWIEDNGSTLWMQYFGSQKALWLYNGVYLRKSDNDQNFIEQINAAGTGLVSLLYLDSSDHILIGPSGGGVQYHTVIGGRLAINDEASILSGYQLAVQSHSNNVTSLFMASGSQTSDIVQLLSPDGTFMFCVGVDGHVKLSAPSGGAGLDVGWKRSAAGLLKITNGSSGDGSIDAAAFKVSGSPISFSDLAGGISWTAPSLVNGWANYGGGFQAARYGRLAGIVYIEGLLNTSSQTNQVCFTLPAGYRPAFDVIFVAWCDGAAYQVRVLDDGTVNLLGFTGGWASIQIQFGI